MTKPAWVEQLEKEPCECVSCPDCKGSGGYWTDLNGKYLGQSRWDDLDQLETCEECGGSGISESCDRCTQLNDYDQDATYA